MPGGIKQRLKIRGCVPVRSLPSADGGIFRRTSGKRFSIHNFLNDHGFIMLVGLNKARQLRMQAMTVVATASWNKQLNLDAATEADYAKTMVIAGKRFTARGADGKILTGNKKYAIED